MPASGKTLCYNLPVLDRLLRHQNARALYLFPTKALAQDQLRSLRELTQVKPAQSALENKRFGLLGMEERVRMMDGTFKIRSAPEQGTKIIVEFPGPVTEEVESRLT